MGKTLIRVECLDQKLIITSAPAIASGGRNEDEIEFSFCPLWAGFAKTAVFYRNEAEVYHATVSADKCIIPHEVLQDDGIMFFGVFGTKGDTTRTSEVIRYRVVKGALTTGTKPSDPTPDIYEQIAAKLSNIETFTVPADPYSLTGDLVQLENFESMPMDCLTVIEPVQSGSGDPYPAGCGKNLLDGTIFTARTSNGVTFTVNTDGSIKANGTATATANTFADITGKLTPGTYVISHSSDFGAAAYVQITSASGSSKNYWDGQAFTLDGTETKIVAYLQINAGTYNGTAYVQIEAGSTATEYAPYSNIRPISGRTGAELTRCGKNLLDDSIKNLIGNEIYFGGKKGEIAVTLPAGTYTFSMVSKNGNPSNMYVKNAVTREDIAKAYDVHFTTFTISDTTPLEFRVYRADYTSVDDIKSAQVEIGAAMTAYEPYQGDTFALDFGQTVYGGQIDWNKGVLTADRAMITLTGNEAWSAGSSNANSYYINQASDPALVANVYVGSFYDEYFHICSHYRADVYKSMMQNAVCEIYGGSGGATIMMKDDSRTTPDAWKAYLAAQYAAGTPVQVAYRLATPTTIQLTPQQITALQGINNIWSDAGETTVSGRKDILWLTQSLAQRVAELEGLVAALTAAAAE